MADPIQTFVQDFGRYPSNVQIWHVAKDADDKFDPSLLTDTNFGSTRAPRGHFILDAFDKNRQQYGNLTLGKNDIPESTRPTTNCFFAGRYWCSGMTSAKSSGKIFYSQIIEGVNNIGRCYSHNDPTAETFNEPRDDDGGVINIPEVGTILALEAIGTGIAIIASNGVWFIRGSAAQGFTPTTYTRVRISTDGCIAPESVVALGDMIYYWGTDGIFRLNFTELDGLKSTNMTVATIKSEYASIPAVSRKHAQGFYNSREMKLHWAYGTTDPVNGEGRFVRDKILTYDMQLEAFFKDTIKQLDTNSPQLMAVFERQQTGVSTRTSDVYHNNQQVMVGTSAVCLDQPYTISIDSGVKGLAMVLSEGEYRFTFTDFNNQNFKEWESADGTGVDAFSFVIPAYEILGEPDKEKRATYVTTHFNRTETGFDANLDYLNPSACLMQAQWDWADSDGGNLKGAKQQVYRYNRQYIPTDSNDTFDYGQSVITTKTKIRGSGRSLTLRFESEEGKDFQLLGWTTNITVRI